MYDDYDCDGINYDTFYGDREPERCGCRHCESEGYYLQDSTCIHKRKDV